MKNASFFYLVSSEIIDINPVLRWKGSSLYFFILFCFYPLHNFLAPISLTWKPVLFIWGKVQAGHLWPYFINLQSYDFNCSVFFFLLIISLLPSLTTAKTINALALQLTECTECPPGSCGTSPTIHPVSTFCLCFLPAPRLNR